MPLEPTMSADELKWQIRDAMQSAASLSPESGAAMDAWLLVAESVDMLANLRAQEAVERYVATLGDEK
jgi:hypothetical protein